MEETVKLRDLTIGYTARGNARVVATDLNHALLAGELTCLLGANGIGKSTLLRTMAGFLAPLRGRIELQGCDIATFNRGELARQISIVLTEKPDIRQMNVEALVALGRQPYTGFWGNLTAADRQAVDEAIAMVGISHLRERNVATLSDGERQKVMIAKALAQHTPVILLDEPTAFLDYPSKIDMLLLLREISRRANKTIFLSTHDAELALQIADRLWLMEKVAIESDESSDDVPRNNNQRGRNALQPDNKSSEELQRNNNQKGRDVSFSVKITSGTPSALAECGRLKAFFAHPGIEFDAERGIKVLL